MSETRRSIFWAIIAAVVSGGIAALALDPVMQIIETVGLDDLLGLLLPFALTAGLAFGMCGAGVALWRMGASGLAAGTFLAASIVGMMAAVHVAVLTYDRASDSFLVPYALGSPVGALILAVPFAFAGRFNRPWRLVGAATVLSTLWAVAVAAVINADAAVEAPGLALLYIGWQGLFLSVFAGAGRKD